MEKILEEEIWNKYKKELSLVKKEKENLTKDLEHYSDLYKTCENNCNTLCKEKLQEAIDKISAQSQSINKAHLVIKKLNEENKSLVEIWDEENRKFQDKNHKLEKLVNIETKYKDSVREFESLKSQINSYEETIEISREIEERWKQEVEDIEAQMQEMQSSFNISYKDLEKAKEFNESLNTQLEKANQVVETRQKEVEELQKKISQKAEKYKNLLSEIEMQENENRRIIDHIKKQAENAMVFYKNKYEKKLRERS